MLFQRNALPLLATLAATISVVSAAPVPSATAITNNPTDVVLRADFPQGNAQTVVGVIQFYSLNGTTKVHVDVTGLPKNSGMFSYHIHEKPVGADKTCAATGAHFNPYGASADCEAHGNDALCEIGDLSGKHGLINTTCFELFYHDPYLSLDPSSPQYIGGKAINIHLENGDRLACATIKPSREPEDLLLLNSETEAEEVRKFEELAGIAHESSIQASAIPSLDSVASSPSPNDVTPHLTAETPIKNDVPEVNSPDGEQDVDPEAEQLTESDSGTYDEEDEDSVDLEELIFEDSEKDDVEENPVASNSTLDSNNTNVTNTSNTSGVDEEENKANSVNSGVAFSVILAVGLALMW